jgi:RimJ/RimL family protein N-acetyltransferase
MSTSLSLPDAAIVLVGERVRLEPLEARHAEGLFEAGRDERIWEHLPDGPLLEVADAAGYIRRALDAARSGAEIPFAILAGSGRVAGSTRYLDIRPRDRALEIGWTWLSPEYQRTAVNTECKYLLLECAFERLGAVRVQLKTDERNLRSQRAIQRLGAVREGVLRKHAIRPRDGYIRNSVMYSIVDDEWPALKKRLQLALRAPRARS